MNIPTDPLTCARLASTLILSTVTAPDHPLVLGTREDLPRTAALIDLLLEHALKDPGLHQRVRDLGERWAGEAARLGLRHG